MQCAVTSKCLFDFNISIYTDCALSRLPVHERNFITWVWIFDYYVLFKTFSSVSKKQILEMIFPCIASVHTQVPEQNNSLFFFSAVKGVHCVKRCVQTAFPVFFRISVFLRGTAQSNSSTLTAIWYTALLHKQIFKTPSHQAEEK